MRLPTLLVALAALVGVSAEAGVVIRGSGGDPPPTDDTCAADALVDSWYMEDLSIANEAGCSVLGDTTWEAVDGAVLSSADMSEGTYSGFAANNLDCHVKDIALNFPVGEGTIWLDVRFVAYSDLRPVLSITYDAQNYIDIIMSGGSTTMDIRCRYEGADAQSAVTADTNIDVAAGKWYRIKYQWKIAATNDHKVDVWELDDSSPRQTTGSAVTGGPEDALTALVASPISIKVGMILNATGAIYYDNLKIFATSDL